MRRELDGVARSLQITTKSLQQQTDWQNIRGTLSAAYTKQVRSKATKYHFDFLGMFRTTEKKPRLLPTSSAAIACQLPSLVS